MSIDESEESRKSHSSKWTAAWSGPLISGLASAIGLSGLLVAIGFMILRSHYSLWGLWGAATNEPTELIAEGGRFLFYLTLVVLDLLDPISSSSPAWFYAVVLGSLALRWLPVEPMASLARRGGKVGKTLVAVLPLLWALGSYYLGWYLLRDVASLFAPVDILNPNTSVPESVEKSLHNGEAVYFDVVRQIIILGMLLAVAHWLLQLKRNRVVLLLAGVSLVFLMAAVSLLPGVYGRLILLPLYPTVSFSSDSADIPERFLIRADSSQWIVWNPHDGRTEVITPKDSEVVSIGEKKPLIRQNTGGQMSKEQSCDAK